VASLPGFGFVRWVAGGTTVVLDVAVVDTADDLWRRW
jgi:hypothetical protein